MFVATVAESPSRGRRSLAKRGLLAVVLSVAANAVVLAFARALRVAPGFRALAWPPVVFLTAVGTVGAVVVYWLLARWSDDPDGTFTVLAAFVLFFSFVPDFFLFSADENATALGVAVLMLMHVVVAAICVAVLTRYGRLS